MQLCGRVFSCTYVHVCMCACVYVCMRVCVYACMRVCVSACMRVACIVYRVCVLRVSCMRVYVYEGTALAPLASRESRHVMVVRA